MKRHKVVIHGSQYKDNFGDTLLLQAVICALRSSGVNMNDIYAATASKKVCIDLNVKKANLLKMIFSRYYIFGGGGYFGQPTKNIGKWSLRFIIRHSLIGMVRRVLKKRYIFIGTGYGPLTNRFASFFSSIVLNGADYILLRDKKSVDYASKDSSRLDVIETADLVPSFINEVVKKEENGNNLILHMHLPLGDIDKLKKIINGYVSFKEINYPEHNIKIITDSESDIEQTWFLDDVKKQYPNIDICEYRNYQDTIDILRRADFVLTNKLHVSIVSASMGINVASIYMHSKTPRFFEQIGRPMSAVPLNKLSEINVLNFLNNVYANGLDMKKIDELCEKSRKNIDTLNAWIANV